MKKTGFLLSVLLLIVSIAPLTLSAEAIASGKEENVNWALTSDGTLTVSGQGDMPQKYDEDFNRLNYDWINYSEQIKSVIIEQGITNIGERAFKGCKELTSVTIPDSVTHIGNYAFEDCDSLTNITIPDSVAYIGDSAFLNCINLASIAVPDSITYIGIGSFSSTAYDYNGSGWENGLFYLDNYLLEARNDISGECRIKEGTTLIAGAAFAVCGELTGIIIPDSVTHIGDNVFEDCIGLTSVTIPDSVTRIGNWSFFGCTGLTDITIPRSVTHIGDQAFVGCDQLTIRSEKGSCAEAYAKANEIPFQDSKDDTVDPGVPGDVNGNGRLDAQDCIKARRAFFGLAALTPEQLQSIDFNGNGRVDAAECLKQRRMFFGLL